MQRYVICLYCLISRNLLLAANQLRDCRYSRYRTAALSDKPETLNCDLETTIDHQTTECEE